MLWWDLGGFGRNYRASEGIRGLQIASEGFRGLLRLQRALEGFRGLQRASEGFRCLVGFRGLIGL